jgi:hypothetical protein
MENPVETKLSDLFHQADLAEIGAAKHGAAIKLTLNTGSRIKDDKDAAIAAAQDYAWAVADRAAFSKAVADAIANGVTYCQTVKGVLAKHYGNRYSRLYDPVGFKGGSLEVATDAPGVKAHLTSMEDYFSKKPEHEVASLEVTSERAGKLFEAIRDAEKALSDHDDETELKKSTRDRLVEALRTRLRGLINELTQLIGREDARWHSFGLNIPAEPDTPAAPQNLTATSTAPHQLHAGCDPVPFADHYRFWTQPSGSDADPVQVGSSKEPSLMLENLAGGSRWKVSVSAVNKAGHEGPRSSVAEVIVLASAAA